MSRIEVLYLDRKIGELSDSGRKTSFCYRSDWAGEGIELSPLAMRLRLEPYVYSSEEFDYLPPLLHDSLPDSYGRSVMKRWFAFKCGPGYLPSASEKLGYVGQSGIGALAFRPVIDDYPSEVLRVMDLRQQDKWARSLSQQNLPEMVQKVKMAAHSVGGRFPKALVAVDWEKGAFYEDDPRLDPRLERWVVKFGTPLGERESLNNYPNIEHAYSQMAQAAGIRVPCTKLIDAGDGKYFHFASERFDVRHGRRMHVATLSALVEVPAGRLEIDYRDLLSATLHLTKDFSEVKEAFRRMVFNVLAYNVDDHGKNHSFIFDGDQWRLSPAYDISFADVSALGAYVEASRAMPVNGNPINPSRKDFVKIGERCGLSVAICDEIIEEVAESVLRVDQFLEDAGVDEEAAQIVTGKVKAAMRGAKGRRV